jgi:hypothetical protein
MAEIQEMMSVISAGRSAGITAQAFHRLWHS